MNESESFKLKTALKAAELKAERIEDEDIDQEKNRNDIEQPRKDIKAWKTKNRTRRK